MAMKRKINPYLKWGCLTPIGVIISMILAIYLLGNFLPSKIRRALPKSATEIQEYYSDSWNGDYLRCLKARLPENDFPIYAKNLGLNEQFDPIANADISSVINMSCSDTLAWWTPPPASRTTFFKFEPTNDFLEIISYSEGYAYYVSASW